LWRLADPVVEEEHPHLVADHPHPPIVVEPGGHHPEEHPHHAEENNLPMITTKKMNLILEDYPVIPKDMMRKM
jgi:hypothetical protein